MYSSPPPLPLPLIGLYPAPASSPQRATVQPLAVPCNAPGAGGRARGWRCPSWGAMLSQGCPIASLHALPNPAHPRKLSPASSVSFARGIPSDTPKLLGCTPMLKQSALAGKCGSPSPLGYHAPGREGAPVPGSEARQRIARPCSRAGASGWTVLGKVPLWPW